MKLIYIGSDKKKDSNRMNEKPQGPYIKDFENSQDREDQKVKKCQYFKLSRGGET